MTRLEDLEKIAARSKKPLPWYGLAMEYRSVGEYQKSVDTFARVHELDAKYVPAYFMCAQVLAQHLGDGAGARRELEQGIAIAREVGDSHAAAEMTELMETLV